MFSKIDFQGEDFLLRDKNEESPRALFVLSIQDS
jgi:hypothetical protein